MSPEVHNTVEITNRLFFAPQKYLKSLTEIPNYSFTKLWLCPFSHATETREMTEKNKEAIAVFERRILKNEM